MLSFLSIWNDSLEALTNWYKVNTLISGNAELLGCIYLTLRSSAKLYSLSYTFILCSEPWPHPYNHNHQPGLSLKPLKLKTELSYCLTGGKYLQRR